MSPPPSARRRRWPTLLALLALTALLVAAGVAGFLLDRREGEHRDRADVARRQADRLLDEPAGELDRLRLDQGALANGGNTSDGRRLEAPRGTRLDELAEQAGEELEAVETQLIAGGDPDLGPATAAYLDLSAAERDESEQLDTGLRWVTLAAVAVALLCLIGLLMLARRIRRARAEAATAWWTANAYHHLSESSPEAHLLVDRSGAVRWTSGSRVASLLGRSLDEIEGAAMASLCHPDDLAALEHLLGGPHEPAPRELELRLRHGEGRWVSISAMVADRRQDPDLAGVLLSLRDVTDDLVEEAEVRDERDFISTVLDSTAVLITVTDPSGRCRRFNDACERLTGYLATEVVGRDLRRLFVIEEESDDIRAHLARLLAPGAEAEVYETTWRTRTGERRRLEWSSTAVRAIDGRVRYLVHVGLDVTERREAERSLRRSEERHAALLAHGTDLVLVLDTEGTVRFATPALERILGHGEGELADLGQLSRILHPDSRPHVQQALDRAADEPGTPVPVACRIRHREGHWRWVEGVLTDLRDLAAVQGVVLNVRDATDRRRAEELLEFQATHDPLTGLINRSLLARRLRERASEHRPTTILFCDLDQFKLVNDGLGHRAGDNLLVQIAERLRALDGAELVARFGGDEFVVVIDNGSRSEVEEILHGLGRELEEPVWLNDAPVFVSMSIGGAVSDGELSADELLQRADVAAHAAKADGPGSVRWFEEDLLAVPGLQLDLQSVLRTAVADEQLALQFQPIYDIKLDRPVGVEALLRWHHPSRGPLSPDQFLPDAEAVGLGAEVGMWAVEQALSDLRRLRDAGVAVRMSINLTPALALQADLAERLGELLERFQLPADAVVLELTEAAAMASVTTIARALEAMRRLGVSIAIDDFGDGHSSLARLGQLPVDVVKLDRSHVALLGRDDRSAAVVRAVVELTQSLGLTLVAEGVEDSVQLEMLRSLGVRFVQGYLLGPPTGLDTLMASHLRAAAAPSS